MECFEIFNQKVPSKNPLSPSKGKSTKRWKLIKKCRNYLPEIVDAEAPEKRDFRSIILLAKVSMEREKLDTSEDEEDGSGKMSNLNRRLSLYLSRRLKYVSG
jgi:hypothetical protein